PALARDLALGLRLPDLLRGLPDSVVLRRRELREVLPDDVGRMIAEEDSRTIVPAHHPAVGVEQEDGIIPDAVEEELDARSVEPGCLPAGHPINLNHRCPRSRSSPPSGTSALLA